MYILKVGSQYVTADGSLSSSQKDAIRVDAPIGTRIVKFKTKDQS